MDSPFLFFILFFSSFLQAYIFPVARTWQAHTWEEKHKCTSQILQIVIIYENHHKLFRYLSKSSLPQHSVLSERVLRDWLPGRTHTQQIPLIDAHVVLIRTEILSAEFNTILSLFPVQRVGPLVSNFTFQTRIQSVQLWKLLWKPAVYFQLTLRCTLHKMCSCLQPSRSSVKFDSVTSSLSFVT